MKISSTLFNSRNFCTNFVLVKSIIIYLLSNSNKFHNTNYNAQLMYIFLKQCLSLVFLNPSKIAFYTILKLDFLLNPHPCGYKC
jgi:hypothetical protein